jgi:hypothetical protein
MSELSGEASGGATGGETGSRGAFPPLLGEDLGGRDGGPSSAGDTDFTVFTEAVDDMESLLDARLIDFDGLIGDLLVSRSSDEVLILVKSLVAMVFTCTL